MAQDKHSIPDLEKTDPVDVTNSSVIRIQFRKKWTDSDEAELLRRYNNGEKIQDIASKLGRTARAISTRLTKFRKKKQIKQKKQTKQKKQSHRNEAKHSYNLRKRKPRNPYYESEDDRTSDFEEEEEESSDDDDDDDYVEIIESKSSSNIKNKPLKPISISKKRKVRVNDNGSNKTKKRRLNEENRSNDFEEWDTNDVLAFLIDIGYTKYINRLKPQFIEDEVDGKGLRWMDMQDLKIYGINNFLDRKKILFNIKNLK